MSVMVNATVSFIRYQMRQEGIWPPEYPVISEAQFNNITGTYLKTLVRRNLVPVREPRSNFDLRLFHREPNAFLYDFKGLPDKSCHSVPFINNIEMAFKCGFLFAAMFTLTVLSSTGFAARYSSVEIIMRIFLEPSRASATKEMLNVYSFIASNNDLSETAQRLGDANTQVCDSNKQRKDNLTIAYAKMKSFMNPVFMAYSYEVAQTPQNKMLKDLLLNVSQHLNNTVMRLRHVLRKNSYPVPSTPTSVPEANLDQKSRNYLTNFVTGTITDDMVKRYRNYVILYTLKDVIQEVLNQCLWRANATRNQLVLP
ncbi:hypothetical protein AWC38_SpisGene2558 [Stylophora pistillata]|uniref:Uncharacterized protein n=1 Tax=Stylophora pistillata TaxID=50429 RepID=A0A2B4SPL9_STYPI|nr:hypothetical protein AWC38_SpisGene2558 [Stylophora pistillata]